MNGNETTIGMVNSIEAIPEIVEIHMRAFPSFFLTFLGPGFLKGLYAGFVERGQGGLLAARNKTGKILGFLAYSEDISGFYRWLIRKKLFALGWYGFLAFLKRPSVMLRLLRAFLYPSASKREERYIELSSLAVLPETQGMGIGGMLVRALKENADFSRFAYIKLETDAEDNDAANRFYQKNGFAIDHQYTTPEGRKMFEYRVGEGQCAK